MDGKIIEIARRIKEMRELSDITQEEIAEKLDISLDRYIRIESGEDEISASNLIEIADILGVDLTLLLTGEEPRMNIFTVTRSGKGVVVERRKQYKYENLAEKFIHKRVEPFFVIADPKDEEPTLHAHPGQEFNYILMGSLKLYIHGNEIILNEGDSIYFDSSYPHGMKALNGKPAKFLAIII
ncbi:MAG: helix-turn-helix transcriptional regulator [Methanosarcinaceae archaeon]|nr:helix-turn-helix transcriptional regulator [Methanosarcinaceae archaeon]